MSFLNKSNTRNSVSEFAPSSSKTTSKSNQFTDNRVGHVFGDERVVQKMDIIGVKSASQAFKKNHVNSGTVHHSEAVKRFEARNVGKNTVIDQKSVAQKNWDQILAYTHGTAETDYRLMGVKGLSVIGDPHTHDVEDVYEVSEVNVRKMQMPDGSYVINHLEDDVSRSSKEEVMQNSEDFKKKRSGNGKRG